MLRAAGCSYLDAVLLVDLAGLLFALLMLQKDGAGAEVSNHYGLCSKRVLAYRPEHGGQPIATFV